MKKACVEIWKIARREFQYIIRDSRLRMVVLIAPFIYAGLFCLIYSEHTLSDAPLALVDQDGSKMSRTLGRMIEAHNKLNIAYRVDSVEELKNLMLAGKIDAAFVIPRNFSQRLKKGRDAFITGYVNAGSMVSANICAKAMNEITMTFGAGVELLTLMKKGERLSAAKEKFMPLKFDLRPMFNPAFNYSNFMVPGLLMAILQQVILLGIALSWTGEKENKTLKNLLNISTSTWVLIVGKALPYLLINGLVAEVYLRILFPLSDIPMQGSWMIAVPFTFLFVLTIVSWGMWVSVICKTRLFATQILMFVAMPSFVLSGFTWPLEAMPAYIRVLSQALPLTYFVNSFRSIYLADAGWAFVKKDFLALGLFSLANIGVTYLLVRSLVRRSRVTGKVSVSLMASPVSDE